jgi:hypothetical protein
MSKSSAVCCALLLSLSTRLSVAQTDGGRGDRDRAITFFHQVQAALKTNDSQVLSQMAQYPMLSSIHGKTVWIRNPEMFRSKYSLIFTQHTREVILGCRDTDVWVRPDEGYSVGRGIVWMDARMPRGQHFPSIDSADFWKAGTFKIITVNGAPEFEKGCDSP